MIGLEFAITARESMNPQMVWAIFCRHTNWDSFKHHSLPSHCCWPWPFMTLYDCSVPSSDGCFLQDNAQCHKPQIISDWFHWTWQRGHSNLMASIKSPDFKPIEHPWNEVEKEIQNSWGTFSAPFWICATNKAKGGVPKEVAGDYTSIKKKLNSSIVVP